MRLAGYVRVFTDDRQDPGLQRAAIERHAQAQGHELIATYEDRGVSGAKASRPGLERLMGDARRRRFEAVVVWRFDRFARSTLQGWKKIARALKVPSITLRRRFQGGHNPPYELRPPLGAIGGDFRGGSGGEQNVMISLPGE